MLLSVVVPVYKEEKNVPEFLRRLRPILGAVTEDYEIIFSLDPSPDRTEDVILEQRAADPRVKLLKFSRRFGQPMATLAGLQYSSGDAVIVMDVDLQDPPELIGQMVAKWREAAGGGASVTNTRAAPRSVQVPRAASSNSTNRPKSTSPEATTTAPSTPKDDACAARNSLGPIKSTVSRYPCGRSRYGCPRG